MTSTTYNTLDRPLSNHQRLVQQQSRLQSTDSKQNPEEPPHQQRTNKMDFASVFRYLGAGAVGLSAILYMLQGLDTIDIDMRNWVYLALMGAFGVCGFISRFAMSDAKGSRLFFALSVMLVPVQFSQLGGMLYSWFSGNGKALGDWFQFINVDPSMLLATGALSVFLSYVLSHFGMSILARKHAKVLTATFLGINIAMLIPFRDEFGFLILGCTTLVAILMELKYFRRHIEFKTMEGAAIRFFFLIPLAIMLTRIVFHNIEIETFSFVGFMVSALLISVSHSWTKEGYLRDLTLLTGSIIAACSWAVWIISLSYATQGIVATLSMLSLLLPIAFLNKYASYRAKPLAALFAALANITLLFSTLPLVATPSILSGFILCILGSSHLAWSIHKKEKWLTFISIIILVGGIAMMTVNAISNISASSWLIFACLGLALVMLSSVIEKYGKGVVNHAHSSWKTVSQW